jgi:hypothetical protein
MGRSSYTRSLCGSVASGGSGVGKEKMRSVSALRHLRLQYTGQRTFEAGSAGKQGREARLLLRAIEAHATEENAAW